MSLSKKAHTFKRQRHPTLSYLVENLHRVLSGFRCQSFVWMCSENLELYKPIHFVFFFLVSLALFSCFYVCFLFLLFWFALILFCCFFFLFVQIFSHCLYFATICKHFCSCWIVFFAWCALCAFRALTPVVNVVAVGFFFFFIIYCRLTMLGRAVVYRLLRCQVISLL